jgi:hypothetical protein
LKFGHIEKGMHTALVIIVSLAAVPAAGFLLAGYAALLSLDESELKAFREEMANAKKKGGLNSYFPVRRPIRFSDIPKHWRTRPDARRAIWIGLFFGLITLIAGLLL